MKILTSALALSLVTLVSTTALAQTTSPGTRPERDTAPERSTTDRDKRDRPAWQNTQGLHETSDIIGTKVENSEGKEVGKVDALLIDPKEGKVTHAVIGLGGFLGLGKDKVVVPYSAVKMAGHDTGRKARIVADQAALESAPKYAKTSDRTPSASPAMSPRSPESTRTDTRPPGDKTDTKSDKK